ncbi:MAG: ECF transporter S component [Eubacteriales bacterium]|nr:ECF transporter S component [Eubacteriales bacterium]
MSQPKKSTVNTRKLATIAILAAIASILFLLEIPVVLFYKLDFSNLPVLLGTFAMGPAAGSAILLLKSALGVLHTTSQGVGELADFLIGLAMVLPAGFIYRAKKSRHGALLGMLIGSLCATVAGVLANVYLLIPFYGAAYGMPVEQIIAMGQTLIPSLDTVWKFVFAITAPFNVLKWAAISVVGWFLYKPLSPLLHGTRRAICVVKPNHDGCETINQPK